MKFSIGEVAFYNWIGDLVEATILKVYPNTSRYRIEYKSEYSSSSSKHFVNEEELFKSKKEYVEMKTEVINKNIKDLEIRKEELQELLK